MSESGRETKQELLGPFTPPLLGERMNFPNNITVTGLGISHSSAYFNQYEQEIKRNLNKFDFVVSEIDLDLINFRERNKNDSIEFYRRVSFLAWRLNKPILFVDPISSFLSTVDGAILGGGLVLAGKGVVDMTKGVTRRQFLKKALIASGGFYVASSSHLGRALTDTADKINLPIFPKGLSYLEFRNAGAVTGLIKASEEGLIEGNGLYVVGRKHLEPYSYYAKHPKEARGVYEKNINNILAQQAGQRLTARLFIPDHSSQNFEFKLAKEISLS